MDRGTSTRAAVVVDELLALITAAAPTGVEVLDGDQPVDAVDDAIQVAPSDPDSPGVIVTYGRNPSLGNAPVEQVEVLIGCRSYSGDDVMADRRARCAEMVAAIQGVVAANLKRENAWDRLELGVQAQWFPVYTERGANCFVGFTIVATGLV